MSDMTFEDRAEREMLERLKEDQRQRWRSGQPRAVEDYLREQPTLAERTESLLELIWPGSILPIFG